MSIYSGFATRNLESLYNRALANMIYLLQSHLSALLRKGKLYLEKINVGHWSKNYHKTYNFMVKLERQKHLEPNFSTFCEELTSQLGIPSYKAQSPSGSSSNLSMHDLDLHILNDGLAYDDSRVPRRPDEHSVRSESSRARLVVRSKKNFYSPVKPDPRKSKRNRIASLYEQRAIKRFSRYTPGNYYV